MIININNITIKGNYYVRKSPEKTIMILLVNHYNDFVKSL
jgi:hypothetical protein